MRFPCHSCPKKQIITSDSAIKSCDSAIISSDSVIRSYDWPKDAGLKRNRRLMELFSVKRKFFLFLFICPIMFKFVALEVSPRGWREYFT